MSKAVTASPDKKIKNWTDFQKLFDINPLASEASREVANLTERKNQHTPFMVSKILSVQVCLSVCYNHFQISNRNIEFDFLGEHLMYAQEALVVP